MLVRAMNSKEQPCDMGTPQQRRGSMAGARERMKFKEERRKHSISLGAFAREKLSSRMASTRGIINRQGGVFGESMNKGNDGGNDAGGNGGGEKGGGGGGGGGAGNGGGGLDEEDFETQYLVNLSNPKCRALLESLHADVPPRFYWLMEKGLALYFHGEVLEARAVLLECLTFRENDGPLLYLTKMLACKATADAADV